MSVAVKLSDDLVSRARKEGAANGRSVAEQIEFDAKVLRAARDNPDLPVEFIRGIFEAEESGDSPEPYEFGPPGENENNPEKRLRKSGQKTPRQPESRP